MEITEQIKEHSITDYDFVFSTGSKLSVSVDHDAGDATNKYDDRYEIHIAGKPSMSDPASAVDEEDMTIYVKNLAFVTVRKRKQRMPTEEEKFAMQQVFSKLIQ